ncbi:Tim44/TimA family putative adaptor protein [Marinibaculum pumilum]|uniref:Tim44/TimA family putative adaptor protein n=1 Tax=Marinibaculum pumilum TaxID=1766165 RepID=A0ABV7KUQ3_9PROT
MGGDYQFLEILLLAMVAGFILLRLRGVLGRRTGHERPPRGLPGSRDVRNEDKDQDDEEEKIISLPERGARDGEEPEPAGPPGLAQVRRLDRNFSEQQFLQGAQAAYEMIVTAFAKGEKSELRPLLSDDVYRSFEEAIDARDRAGETHETTLIGIKSATISEANVTGRVAEVTVKIVAELMNQTKNAQGEVIGGSGNTIEIVAEYWTFRRDLSSSDPNWVLIATSDQQ